MPSSENIKKYLPMGYLIGFCIYIVLVSLIYILGFITEPSFELTTHYLIDIGQYLYPSQILNKSTSFTSVESNSFTLYSVIGFWSLYISARVISNTVKKSVNVIGSFFSLALTSIWCLSVCLLWLGANIRM